MKVKELAKDANLQHHKLKIPQEVVAQFIAHCGAGFSEMYPVGNTHGAFWFSPHHPDSDSRRMFPAPPGVLGEKMLEWEVLPPSKKDIKKDEDGYFRKEGRKYVKVFDHPRLYSEGIWLVTGGGDHSSQVAKLCEINGGAVEYARKISNTIGQLDNLSSFLLKNKETTTFDLAKSILKFLAESEEEQNKILKNK